MIDFSKMTKEEIDICEYIYFVEFATLKDFDDFKVVVLAEDNITNLTFVEKSLNKLVKEGILFKTDLNFYYLSNEALKAYHTYEIKLSKDDTFLYQPFTRDYLAEGNEAIVYYLNLLKNNNISYTLEVKVV
jgi:hypothetical protein